MIKLHTNRIGLVYVGFLLMAAVVVWRIVDLQFIHVPEDRRSIKKSRTERVLYATRGSILSDDGRFLAFSIPEYRMGMDCAQANDSVFAQGIDSLSICLARFYKDKSSSQYKKEIIARRKSGKEGGSRYLVLNRQLLSYQEMKEVGNFPILREGRNRGGRSEEKVDHRSYPYGRLGYRTLGYVKNLEDVPTVGLEGSCDSILRGMNGIEPLRLTDNNQWITDTERKTILPVDGLDIQTTIDIDLQDIAHNALKSILQKTDELHAGTVIVMEVATGEIRAMVNLEKTGKGGFDETYNYAIGRKGEPGSVFKAATLALLLEEGKVKLDDRMPATVEWVYGKTKFTDHYLDKYSDISIRRGLEISSNNVFRIQAAKHYGSNPDHFLNQLTGKLHITRDFPFELNGFAGANLKSTKSKSWNMVDLPQIAMGYTVEITPLHTLNYYNAIAGGGVMVRPHLVRNYQKNGVIVKEFDGGNPERIMKKSTADSIASALRGVVCHEGGTGYNVFKGCPVAVAGKTGTARIVFPGTGRYEDKYGNKMHQATFVGFFPYEKPEYSMIAVVYSEPTKRNYYGATWSGPVFREIAEQLYNYTPQWQEPLPQKGIMPDSVKTQNDEI